MLYYCLNIYTKNQFYHNGKSNYFAMQKPMKCLRCKHARTTSAKHGATDPKGFIVSQIHKQKILKGFISYVQQLGGRIIMQERKKSDCCENHISNSLFFSRINMQVCRPEPSKSTMLASFLK